MARKTTSSVLTAVDSGRTETPVNTFRRAPIRFRDVFWSVGGSMSTAKPSGTKRSRTGQRNTKRTVQCGVPECCIVLECWKAEEPESRNPGPWPLIGLNSHPPIIQNTASALYATLCIRHCLSQTRVKRSFLEGSRAFVMASKVRKHDFFAFWSLSTFLKSLYV